MTHFNDSLYLIVFFIQIYFKLKNRRSSPLIREYKRNQYTLYIIQNEF